MAEGAVGERQGNLELLGLKLGTALGRAGADCLLPELRPALVFAGQNSHATHVHLHTETRQMEATQETLILPSFPLTSSQQRGEMTHRKGGKQAWEPRLPHLSGPQSPGAPGFTALGLLQPGEITVPHRPPFPFTVPTANL